jgi:hypothetical protein
MRRRRVSECLVGLAGAAFIWSLVLSVCPSWHERIHTSASGADHSCAVTFVRASSMHHAPPAAPAISGVFAASFTKLPELTESWVQSSFQTAAIFEHAPPSLS